MEINIQEILAKHTIILAKSEENYYKEAIFEIITEVLKEAADSAETTHEGRSWNRVVNKESITSTINKVKF